MTTPHIDVNFANNTSYVALVDVSGTSGVLEGIGIAGAELHHYVRIALDDQPPLVDNLICGCLNNYENTGLTMGLPFNERLLVEIKDDPLATVLPKFWASYTTAGSRLKEEYEKLEVVEGVAHVFKVKTFESPQGATYKIKSLEGCKRIAEVTLEQDVYERQRPVDLPAQITLRNWQGEPQYASDVNLLVRPAGRATAIRKIPVGNVSGELKLKLREKISDVPPGTFLVQTDLKGWANIPAQLTVL